MKGFSVWMIGLLVACAPEQPDDLSAYVPPRWTFTEDTVRSEMDDSTRFMNQLLYALGETVVVGDSSLTTVLQVQCKDELAFSVVFGERISDREPVRMRLDSAAAFRVDDAPWLVSTKGYLFGGWSLNLRRFLADLSKADVLRVEYTPELASRPRTSRFEVAGVEEHLAKLTSPCPPTRPHDTATVHTRHWVGSRSAKVYYDTAGACFSWANLQRADRIGFRDETLAIRAGYSRTSDYGC
jgi:hypothetical protein